MVPILNRVTSLIRWLVRPEPVPGRDPTGILAPRGRWEYWGLLLAVLFGVFAAGLYEQIILQNPLPPGGDPGEWTAGSFGWVGLPTPTWFSGSATPPLLLPFLGALVILGGGPIGGAQLFIAAQLILYGLTFYVLARSFSVHPITALTAEAFMLLNTNTESLYLSGAYQFLFSWVFLNLTVAFAVRFVRSRRSVHLAVFWVAASAAVLTHPLMEFAIPAIIGIAGLFLLWMRQLPREVVLSWVGGLGATLFVASEVGWYVLVPRVLGLHQNNLAFQGAYFQTIQTSLNGVLLPELSTLLLHDYIPQGAFGTTLPFQILVAVLLVLGTTLVVFRLFRPGWLTAPVVFLGAWTLAMVGLAVYGWHQGLVTTYPVFGEILVPVEVLTLVLAAEWLLVLAGRVRPRPRIPIDPGPLEPARARWRRMVSGRYSRPALQGLVALVTIVIVAAYGVTQTVPALQASEASFTTTPHNASFQWALQTVKNSGLPGSIFTTSKATSWMRAITARDVYAPFLPAYSFNTPHILILEQTSLALSARYSVTNGEVVASIGGNTIPDTPGLPTYSASNFGLFFPVLQIPPASLIVRASNGTGTSTIPLFPSGGPGPTVLLPPVGQSYLVATTITHGLNLTINATALTTSPGVRIVLNVTSNSANLLNLSAVLTTPRGAGGIVSPAGGAGAFITTVSQAGGYGTTFGNVTPANAIGAYGTTPTQPGYLQLTTHPTNASGDRWIQVTIDLVSPYSTNLIDNLPPCVVAPNVFSDASARFFLYEPASVPSQFRLVFPPSEPVYLETEYGAVQYATNGDWTVLLLPSFPPGPYVAN